MAKRFSGSLLDWGGTTDSPLSNTLALVASFQTALGDLQLKIVRTGEFIQRASLNGTNTIDGTPKLATTLG